MRKTEFYFEYRKQKGFNIMVKAANYYKKIVQVGQQQRSGFVFRKAMELIREDKIGKLRKVNIWDDANNRFTNSESANKLITPVYREPWILPKF